MRSVAPFGKAGGLLAFLVLYVALDWVSFFQELSPIGITPWNPGPGLALAVMILYGARLAPWVFAATMLADLLVRGVPVSPVHTVTSALLVAIVYGFAAAIMRRHARLEAGLASLREVFWLTAIGLVSALLVAVGHIALYLAAGELTDRQVLLALSRYWIGDMIGIAVVVPLMLVHWRPFRLPRPAIMVEAVILGGIILLALFMFFGLDSPYEFRFVYLLFLPLIWIGARFGIEGATLGNLFAQIGLIMSFGATSHSGSTVTTFQYLMLALATACLFLGAAVSERRRIEAALRMRQDELAHFSRLSLAGEMAAALAHELNQPLLATIAFTRAAQRMLGGGTPDLTKAGGALDRAVDEAQRAGAIIRTLREFIGKGATHREVETLGRMVTDAHALAAPECARLGVRLGMNLDRALPPVLVDRVQVQQVLLNLIRNAMESVTTVSGHAQVTVSASMGEGNSVEVEVRDNGPGIDAEVAERLFEPFNTSKASGMGLGLSISRTIVEAHGGRLWLAANGPAGAAFRFTLPVAGAEAGTENSDLGSTA